MIKLTIKELKKIVLEFEEMQQIKTTKERKLTLTYANGSKLIIIE